MVTDDDAKTLLMVRGVVTTLPQEQQDKVRDISKMLRELLTKEGLPALLAVTIVTGEAATGEFEYDVKLK